MSKLIYLYHKVLSKLGLCKECNKYKKMINKYPKIKKLLDKY